MRKPTTSPVLTKCWKWELMLTTNFGSLCQMVTKFGSQNFGYQIWFCTRLIKSLLSSVSKTFNYIQYIPRNMHTVFALLCFAVVIHWLIFPYPSGLHHWHCGNLTIAPVPAKQPWWIWINTSCEFIMNDCITTTKQSTTKPCAYFLGYTVCYFVGHKVHNNNREISVACLHILIH